MPLPYNLPSSMSGSGRLSVGFNDAHARVKITACPNPHYVGKKGIYAGSNVSTNYYVVNENGVHNFTDSTPIPSNTTVESRYSFAGSFHPFAAGDNPVSTKMFEYKGDLYLAFTMCINDFEGPVSPSWPQGDTGPTDLTGHPHPPSMVLRFRWENEALTLVDKLNLNINASTAVFIVDEYAGTLSITYSEAAFPTQAAKTLVVNLSTLTASSPTTLFSVNKTLCPTDAFDARNIVYTSGVLSYDENEPIVRVTNSEISEGKVTLTFTVATPDSREVAIVPFQAYREVLGETTPFVALPPVYPVQSSVDGLEYSYSYPFTNAKECFLQHKIVAIDRLGPHGNIDVSIIGNTVTFDATRSWCLESDIVSYAWSFGADTALASYTFPNPTQRLIYLTLRDANGRESISSTQLTIGTPVASFTAVANGLRVTLTPSGGTTYKWDIQGTGSWESPTVFHFNKPQTATIILTADDTYTTSQTVTVAHILPTAAFTSSTTFMDISLNGNGGVGYAWSFSGDIVGEYVSGSSTTQNAVFRCFEEYSGNATLTVVDEYGMTDSVTHPVATDVSAPTAAITSSGTGSKRNLSGLTSTSPNGEVIEFTWAFDPVLPASYLFGDAEKPVITLLFSSNYSGTATLTVKDDKGISDSVTAALSVTVSTPSPAFTKTQANDVLILDASSSTGCTTYQWSFSGSPDGYWIVGDANTKIAHFRFNANYTGSVTLTVNTGITTTQALTFNFGVAMGFAGRVAVAYPPLIPQTMFPGFAERVAEANDFFATNTYYMAMAARTPVAYAVTLSPHVKPAPALRVATGYAPSIHQTIIPSPALRTSLAFSPNLSFVVYPGFASRTATAYAPTLHQTVIPTPALNVATAYGVTFA